MDIDQSKENIQPLRGGRNVHQLGTALQAQSDVDAQRQLLLQKEEHEALITNYEGPDPLDPWFNYIQWVEQCFPKHGHEGHIVQIIKECLHRFEKDERYFQDRRFVKLWIKYIDCLTNPLEIYQKLYSTGIGIQCAELYRAWACYCVESGDYKKANQVYILGLQTNAQPIEELKEAHTNFHIFYAQRMLHSDDSPTKRKADSALAETRMALTCLRTFKRRNVANAPIQRTGDNIQNPLPGVMRQQVTGTNEIRAGTSNIMVNIYEDAPSTSQTPVPIVEVEATPSSVLQMYSNMENEKEVGMWSNSRTSKSSQPTVPHQPLPFAPYEDEDQLRLGPNHLPYCAEDLNSSIALCVPDPPDPSKIPCYDKAAVYVENTEYSLEEIRARKFTLRQAACASNSIESVKASSIQTPTSSSPDSKYMYRPRQTMTLSTMTSDNDQLDQFIPLSIAAVQNVTDVRNVESPGEPQVLVNLDSNEYNSTNMPNTMPLCAATSAGVPSTSSHTINVDTGHGCPDRCKSNESKVINNGSDAVNNIDNSLKNFAPPIDEYNRSLIENMHGDSITVNTKEARWELRNLFNDNESSMVQPVIPQFDASQFNIHEDCSMTIALKKKSLAPSQRMEEMPQMAIPEDKENGPQSHRIYTIPANPTSNATIDEEVTSTQTFNFNLKTSSTPNMAQFKKPQVFTDVAAKGGAIKKLMTEESAVDLPGGGDNAQSLHLSEEALQTFNTDTSTNKVLSAIIEESYNSKSGSSSGSVQQTRNMTVYNSRDINMHGHYEQLQAGGYESPAHVQPRLANGQFARTHPVRQSAPPIHHNQPYSDIEQHYQKNTSRFTAQRTVHAQAYRQPYIPTETAYRVPSYPSVSSAQPSYSNATQREFSVPNATAFTAPHHVTTPGVRDPTQQSPSHASAEYAGGQATYSSAQFGYRAPAVDERSGYPNSSCSEYTPAPSAYPSASGCTSHSPFRSPPHRSLGYAQHFRSYPQDASYGTPSRIHTQQEPQHVRPGSYSNNHSFHSSSYAMHIGSSELNKPESQNYSSYHGSMHQTQYRTYQNPAPTQLQHSQFGNSMAIQQNTPAMQTPPSKPRTLQASQSESYTNQMNYQQNSYLHHQSGVHQHANRDMSYPPETEERSPALLHPLPSPAAYKSPTSVLRSVRHEQQHKAGPQHSAALPEGGYSNQFLNFISSRNEPKDDNHMPKFTNSPSISQKMHKNLYVSSPEPMAATTTSTDAKNATVSNNATPIQSAKVTTTQQKDISKRQLDFDHRIEFQSEDSRDSLSKDSRISSVRSRQSLQSDGFSMDVDNDNSMECHTFKSTCANSTVETKDVPRPAAVDFPDVINPFNNELCNSLLQYVKFPNKTHCEGYVEVRTVPKLQQGITLSVGSGRYSIEKQLGKGTYGSVFASLDLQNNKLVALKYQKPGHPWEFYICKEIKARIKDPFMLPGYMDVSVAYFGDSASIFVSELSKYGSLLDVANKVKVATSKCIHESIVMLLTTEMLSIVHYLHKAEIIHADMKPDNFLLMKIPTSEWRTPSLQLIDLGCAIDMSLFPEGTSFKKVVSTEGFTCTEMRERRSWTYQTDLYCLAGTIHVILLGSYMKTVNRLGQWNIDKKLPRYIQGSLWDKVFTTLLNVPDCQSFPDLMDLKNDLEMYCSKDDNLSSQLRSFANVLKSR